jgi:hypothetical protein
MALSGRVGILRGSMESAEGFRATSASLWSPVSSVLAAARGEAGRAWAAEQSLEACVLCRRGNEQADLGSWLTFSPCRASGNYRVLWRSRRPSHCRICRRRA